MNIPGFSTNGLLMMHSGILNALEIDDATAAGSEKPYGVREFADWRSHCEKIEAELDKRQVQYVKIKW